VAGFLLECVAGFVGIRIEAQGVPHDPEFQRVMEAARAIMEKRREMLRKLAKL
jgi:hypothetical protein